MASFELMKDIVRNGSDLILYHAISYDVLKELAMLARKSGAQITIATEISLELTRELSKKYGKTLVFVHGTPMPQLPVKLATKPTAAKPAVKK